MFGVWAAKVGLFYYLADIDSYKAFTLQLFIFNTVNGALILPALSLRVKNHSFDLALFIRGRVMHFGIPVLIRDAAPIDK